MLLAATNSGTLIIALPDLERSLHTSLLALVWVILAYLIAATVLVLMAGRLSDLFGRKRAYVGGFVLFALASLGAGFSPDATVLIVWRILQGIGSAFLFANAAALVTDAFPQRGTRSGDGRQHDGRRDRPGARPGARRRARGDLLALGVLVQRAVRARRRHLGRADPARARQTRLGARLRRARHDARSSLGLTGLVLGVSRGGHQRLERRDRDRRPGRGGRAAAAVGADRAPLARADARPEDLPQPPVRGRERAPRSSTASRASR